MGKMSRLEMYKAAIEYAGSEKGSIASFVKQLVSDEEVSKESAPLLGAFIKRNIGKIKFDMSKREALMLISKLQALQTAGQDNDDSAYLTTQLKGVLDRMSYFPTDPRDIGNYDGSVEDVRTGFEDSENSRLSTLAQKLKQ